MKHTRAIASVSFGTLISRILGYARDILLARFMGAGLVADAFFAAYKIPNLLRHLLGEGGFSPAFVPVTSEYLENKSQEETRRFISASAFILALILGILCIIGVIFAPAITRIVAPGFLSEPEKFRLTAQLTRIIFPYAFAICLAAFVMGILHSLRKFFIPALAPAFFNLTIIAYLLIAWNYVSKPVQFLAVAVVIGGFVHLAVELFPLKRSGYFPGPPPRKPFSHPGVRQVGKLLIPALIGVSVVEINSLVDTICASFLVSGSVTALYYSNRLVQLPLAIFGTAIATVALPVMSTASAKGNIQDIKDTIVHGVNLAIFAALPAAIGLILFAKPIIQVLFGYGKFDISAVNLTAWALLFYAFGLASFSMVKIFASCFYSLKDTATPVRIAAIAMLVNVGMNLLVVLQPTLKRVLGVGGLALATSLSSTLNLILLIVYLRRRIGPIGGRRIWRSSLKFIVAGLLMSAAALASWAITPNWHLIPRVSVLVVIAALVYYWAARMCKSKEASELLHSLIK